MKDRHPIHLPFLAGLLICKALLHILATANSYGLHRDEYLYLAESNHLMLGYMESPPVIGWVAGISTTIFGSSEWAGKFPVLLVGLFSIWLIMVMVRELGGNKYAQLIAGTAWLLSPVYLGSNNLFQPVSFNQFCWLLVSLAWIRVINYQRPKDWYLLGVAAGIGLMTKYSIAFFLVALVVGILLTSHRKWLIKKEAWIAVGIAFIIWLPNLWWQYHYGFPVVGHMRELATTQLVNVTLADFLIPQFLFHFASILVWLPGLLFLGGVAIKAKDFATLRSYRSLAWAYGFTLLLLVLFSGKSYYTYGAYSVLMAAGGVWWVKQFQQKALWVIPVLLTNFVIIPYGLPILPVDKMQDYGVFMRDNFSLKSPLRWEDGNYYDLSQDYADMHGWEELVAAVAKFYHSLSPEEQAELMIYAGNYGQAGALTFYRKKYDLPVVHSFNSSFLLWEPSEVSPFTRQIAIEDSPDPESRYFGQNMLVDSTYYPFAREKNYIYYRSKATEDLVPVWREIVLGQRKERLE